MYEIRWADVRAEVPGARWAEDAGVDRKHVELRLRKSDEGCQVTARFYAGGVLLETWSRDYQMQAHAENGYREVKRRANRWLNGFHLRGLKPPAWRRERN